MIVVLPELVGALRRHADRIQSSDARKSDRLRRRSYRLSNWSTRLCRIFPAAYPLALRERALIAANCGKTRQALKFAEKSCAVAKQQKAAYELAQSALLRARLRHQSGIPGAEDEIEPAEAEMERFQKMIEASLHS